MSAAGWLCALAVLAALVQSQRLGRAMERCDDLVHGLRMHRRRILSGRRLREEADVDLWELIPALELEPAAHFAPTSRDHAREARDEVLRHAPASAVAAAAAAGAPSSSAAARPGATTHETSHQEVRPPA